MACASAGTQIQALQYKCELPACCFGLGGLGWDRPPSQFSHMEWRWGAQRWRGKGRRVRRIAREWGQRRVWDCCPGLDSGLNEQGIRVKCSVCVSIKRLWVQGPAGPSLIPLCQFGPGPPTCFSSFWYSFLSHSSPSPFPATSSLQADEQTFQQWMGCWWLSVATCHAGCILWEQDHWLNA